jgi:hypothetical protein
MMTGHRDALARVAFHARLPQACEGASRENCQHEYGDGNDYEVARLGRYGVYGNATKRDRDDKERQSNGRRA